MKFKKIFLFLFASLVLASCSFERESVATNTVFNTKFWLWAPIDPKLNVVQKKSFFSLTYKNDFFYHLEFRDGSSIEKAGTYLYDEDTIFVYDGEVLINEQKFLNYYETTETIKINGEDFVLVWHAENIFG